MFARCLCFSLIAVIATISSNVRADGASRGFTSTQTTATGGGGGSLDKTVSDLVKKDGEPKAKATGVSRGFTSSQTSATGGGGSSLDDTLSELLNKKGKKQAKAMSVPTTPTAVPGDGAMERALSEVFQKMREGKGEPAPIPRFSNFVAPKTATGRRIGLGPDALNPVQPAFASSARSRVTKPRAVADTRPVIAKSAFASQNLSALTGFSTTRISGPRQASSPVAPSNLSGASTAGTQISPVRLASQ